MKKTKIQIIPKLPLIVFSNVFVVTDDYNCYLTCNSQSVNDNNGPTYFVILDGTICVKRKVVNENCYPWRLRAVRLLNLHGRRPRTPRDSGLPALC